MEPTDRPLDHPAVHTQATAVGRPPLGQLRVDPPAAQLLSLVLIVEAPVAQGAVRAAPGVTRPAGAGAGLFAPADGADVPRVDEEPAEVDLVGAPEVGQQDLVDPVPGAGRLPVAQSVP